MFLILGYLLLICSEIVTANSGRKGSVYRRDLSDICKRRIISSVFLGTGVLDTDSETLDFSRLELPYDCYVKIKAEPGANIILVAQIEDTDDLVETCRNKPNQFLVLDMGTTYGAFWETLAVDFSTPEYKEPRPPRTWELHNYGTTGQASSEPHDEKTEVPMETKMVLRQFLKSTLPTPAVVDQKPTQIVQEQTQALKTTETDFRYISSIDENNFGSKKSFKYHENCTDVNNGNVNGNFQFGHESFEEQDDYLENDSEENNSKMDKEGDSKTDIKGESNKDKEGDSETDEKGDSKMDEKGDSKKDEKDDTEIDKEDNDTDEEKQESVEKIEMVTVFEPGLSQWTPPIKKMRTPRIFKTPPRPYIHFAPRYKKIFVPQGPKARDESFKFKDDGSLDYLWRYMTPTREATKHFKWTTQPTIMGFSAWQKEHDGYQPNKYVNYDDDENESNTTTKKPSSPERYFFNAVGDRKRYSPDKMMSFRTRLKYFHDVTTKSMVRTTQSKQRLVTHKAPYFKLKSTTQYRTTLLRNKTLISARKDKHPILSIYQSRKETTKNEKHKFLFVRNQKNQKSIAKTYSQNYHKTNIPTSRINTKKARNNTIIAENSASIATIKKSKPYHTARKLSSTKMSKPYQTARKLSSTKMQTNKGGTLSGISNKITSFMEIEPYITVSTQRSAFAATPTKTMKHNTEDSSKITITTISEYEYLKQLLSNFRRNAKADDVSHREKSTANISRTIFETTKIKTLSKPNIPVSTINTTSSKLTSPSHHIWNHTAVSTSTATYFNASTDEALELTKQFHFQPTKSTSMPSFHTSLKTTLRSTSDKALELTKQLNFQPTKSTSMPSFHTSLKTTLRSTSVSVLTSSVSNNETLNTTIKGTSPESPVTIEESHKIDIPTTNTLNTTTRKTNATLKSTATQSDLINSISTKSNITSSYTLSSKATPNVTTTKEASAKVTAHTQATSQTYQEEIKRTQENSKSNTTLTTNQSSTKIYKDSIRPSKPLKDILTTTTSTVAVTISTSSEMSTLDKATTNVMQKHPRKTIGIIPSSVTKENETHEIVSPTTLPSTLLDSKSTFKESDTKSTQAKMFVAAQSSTTRKSDVFSGGSNVTTRKEPRKHALFSAETWKKNTLAYKSWENLIQAAPDMVSSLNRTKQIWKAKHNITKAPKAQKRVKRRLEYIPIEDSRPHTQEIMPPTTSRTSRHAARHMDHLLAYDQQEEDYGRAHFGRLESYLGPVLYNICRIESKKTRLVALFNTSSIFLIMNDFTLERLNLIVTSATTIAQTLSQCPYNQLECQVSGVRVCIDISSACDDIPNCGAYDIYDEDRILCGFNVTFKHSLVLTAITFIVMISIGIYSVHYWLKRCIPHVSEAFFVYTDTAENVLHLDTIMRSPNATDEFPPLKFHVPEFEIDLRMHKRIVNRGLCSLLFRALCPCCKIFKPTAEAPISLEQFDEDHSDTGSHFEKMFQYSAGDMERFVTHQDDKTTQTSFILGEIERGASFFKSSQDSLMNKLGDLRHSHSYNNELELIKKMRDKTVAKPTVHRVPHKASVSTVSIDSQRITANELELRNTIYDMAIPVTIPTQTLSDQEIIDQPDEEIEALVEPTKRLRFNEQEAGPSDVQDNKARKLAIDSRRRTSIDMSKKRTQNSKF